VKKYVKITATKKLDIFEAWCTYFMKPDVTLETHLSEYKLLA
jgi:hypothetical protein